VLGKGGGFADYKRVWIKGGHGGNGCISFDRTPRTPIGPPSGGNGGKGGDVYIVTSKHVTSLADIKERYTVENGRTGRGKCMHGPNGEDIELVVPVGTVLRQLEVPSTPPTQLHEDPKLDTLYKNFVFKQGYEPQEDRIKIWLERIPYKSKKQPPLLELDLAKDGERILIRKGGRGGFGNTHFQTPLVPGPPLAGRGDQIPNMLLELELKTIADVGLVGLPNAGKSTLLKAVSNAHPQIAPYPFTTLNPYVGTIEFQDHYTLTISDMPGIIKGAHQNMGLGLRFLRHIERNRIFVYVIDIAASEPWSDLETLQNELERYKPGLTNRPSVIVANKADVSSIAKLNLSQLQEHTKLPIVPISAKHEKNITVLTGLLRSMIEDLTQ
jgi:GTP-binding protein